MKLTKQLDKLKKDLPSRPCVKCNNKTLLLSKVKRFDGKNTAQVSFYKATASEKKQYNGTIIKVITMDEIFSCIEDTEIDGTPSQTSIEVFCTSCETLTELVPKGNTIYGGMNYTPHALVDTGIYIPKNRCLSFTTQGKGCKNRSMPNELVCKKHDSENNKKRIENWLKSRGIPVDLT